MTQEEALMMLKTGANIFLTGEPGSGKTHTINRYVAYLRSCGIEPAITASTGIAATHIHGMTIHSWSGIGIREKLTSYDLDKIANNERVAKRIMDSKVLIIDEVSMLAAKTFEMVDAVCREIRRSSKAFGGLQVVVVGDFFQLPPIVRREVVEEDANTDEIVFEKDLGAKKTHFAYGSSAWKALNPLICYLGEQHRQEDGEFLGVLSAIRANECGPAERKAIEARMVKENKAPAGCVRLFPHNADVDRINVAKLGEIDSKARVFTMTSFGAAASVETLKRGCLSPEALSLKEGASVMFTKNNPSGSFVNGTLGTITGFVQDSGSPVVKTRDGRHIVAEPMEWAVEEEGKIRAKISQVPLRLAWAITVHKSQGMSLDAAVMDLSQTFEYGQGYVALSRVRTLAGLYLLGLNERALQVHPEALQKDTEFREQSEDALQTFSELPKGELSGMHQKFVSSMGGSIPSA